jgi:hypothetical protein
MIGLEEVKSLKIDRRERVREMFSSSRGRLKVYRYKLDSRYCY